MRADLFVYISGPITGKHGRTVEQNVADATAVYWALLQQGIPAFCPHLSAAFPTAFTALDYDAWMQYDYAVIDRCTHVLLLPRWELSTGAQLEANYALDKGIPIAHSVTELLAMAHSAVAS